jgi:hypothetical protein
VGEGSRSSGTGSILFTPTDIQTGEKVNIMLENVAYLPDQPHNLLSHGTMREHDFIPDFENLTVTHGDHVFALGSAEGFFPFTDSPYQGNDNRAAAVGEERDRTDWKWITSEYEHYAGIYGGVAGNFTHELFYSAGNRQGPAVWDGDSFTHDWVGENFYGNPVFQNSFITRTLEKAIADFDKSPDDTSFFIVVPNWKDAPWYPLLSQFQVVHTYDKGSEIFTAPGDQVFNRDALRGAGEDGGDDRVFVDGTDWPVLLIFKDKHTVTKIDHDWLLHARLGHPGHNVVKSIIDQGLPT